MVTLEELNKLLPEQTLDMTTGYGFYVNPQHKLYHKSYLVTNKELTQMDELVNNMHDDYANYFDTCGKHINVLADLVHIGYFSDTKNKGTLYAEIHKFLDYVRCDSFRNFIENVICMDNHGNPEFTTYCIILYKFAAPNNQWLQNTYGFDPSECPYTVEDASLLINDIFKFAKLSRISDTIRDMGYI